MNNLSNLVKSRVFWVNIASIGLEIGTQLSTILPPGTVLIGINVLNILLRVVTTKALADK